MCRLRRRDAFLKRLESQLLPHQRRSSGQRQTCLLMQKRTMMHHLQRRHAQPERQINQPFRYRNQHLAPRHGRRNQGRRAWMWTGRRGMIPLRTSRKKNPRLQRSDALPEPVNQALGRPRSSAQVETRLSMQKKRTRMILLPRRDDQLEYPPNPLMCSRTWLPM